MNHIIPALICAAVFSAMPAEQISYADSAEQYVSMSAEDSGAIESSGLDDTAALQEALDNAAGSNGRIGTVTIPSGIYYISKELTIHSNTTLNLESGAIIIRLNSEYPMLVSADDSGNLSGGYSHASNITVNGGEWDGGTDQSRPSAMLFSINHASNILLSDMTIRNFCDTHAVILNACNTVTVRNVSISDFRKSEGNTSSDWYQEALHIDYTSVDQAIIGRAAPLDNTPCRNVTVENCTFTNVAAGVGTHHDYKNLYEDNINIIGCTFKNISGACVNGYGFRSVRIQDNTAENCLTFARLVKCSGTVSGNTADLKKSSDTTGHQLRASNSTLTVTSNRFTGSTDGGIIAVNGSNISMTGNVISSVKGCAVKASSGSTIASEGDTLKKCGRYGAYACAGTQIKLTNDKICNIGKAGVYADSAKNVTLTKCKIYSVNEQGVYSSSTPLKLISCNVTGTGGDGVYAVSGSCTVKNSSIYKCGSRGVAFKNVKVSIVSNKIYANTTDSVRLAGSTSGTVKSNLIGAYGMKLSSTVNISDVSNLYRFAECSLKLSEKSFKYTGKEIKPKVTVVFGNKKLKKDVDYKITYVNNTERGKATVKVTGIGNYTGTLTQKFTIK
jgi:hypothetical protein